MLSQGVRTLFITGEQVFQAAVATGGRRLLDLLNDGLTDYVQARDAQVFHDLDMATTVASFPSACVRKEALSLVILPEEGHEAPEKRFFGYVQKLPQRVFVAVPGYEVEGRLHLLRAGEAVTVLTHDLGEFFPVTQAQLRHTRAPFEVLDVPVVMIHKSTVALFCLEEA